MQPLTKEELKTMFDNDDDFVLVNVLGREAFEKAHIPMSLNIPGSEDLVPRMKHAEPDTMRKLVLYCANFDCQASPNAAEKLRQAGYTNVFDFEGGMKDWQDAGYPVAATLRCQECKRVFATPQELENHKNVAH